MIADLTTIFDYEAQPKEPYGPKVCNLCGGERHVLETIRDRYGFEVGVAKCWHCQLVTLRPMMTAEAYAGFYDGPYRALVSAFHGREINADTMWEEQHDYAREIGAFLTPYVHIGHKTLLDIGGSTGVVARYLCNRFDLRGTVIDPAPAELRKAKEKGLNTIAGTIESYEIPERWDVITLCQTVDHLLDINGTLAKIHSHLTGDGVFFVDIVNYAVTKELKIDHPYNLTESTMERYLARRGFTVVAKERAPDKKHVRYLTVKSVSKP